MSKRDPESEYYRGKRDGRKAKNRNLDIIDMIMLSTPNYNPPKNASKAEREAYKAGWKEEAK